MLNLVITVIVIGLIVWLFLWALNSLPLIPDMIRQIIRVFIVVVACLYVINILLGHGTGFNYVGLR